MHAAAGGVGHLAVQIAKAHGAYVIGTAREHHHNGLRDLGIDEVIDYTQQDVAAATSDIDVMLDLVGGNTGADSLHAVRDGGLLINVPSSEDGERARRIAAGRVQVTNILVEPDRTGMDAIAAMVRDGKLRPKVAKTFALAQAAQAHETGERGRTGGGKLVLVTDAQLASATANSPGPAHEGK